MFQQKARPSRAPVQSPTPPERSQQQQAKRARWTSAEKRARWTSPEPPVPTEQEELDEVRTEWPLFPVDLERVLGPQGRTLIYLRRSCGASIALRPVLKVDGDDEFVLEVSGTAAAVLATEEAFAELLELGDRVPGLDLQGGDLGEDLQGGDLGEDLQGGDLGEDLQGGDLGEDLQGGDLGEDLQVGDLGEDLQGGDLGEDLQVGDGPQVIEIEIPRLMVAFVISGRTPGGKGLGKSEGLLDLKRVTGVRELAVAKSENTEKALLRVVGESVPLSQLTEIMEERKAACDGIVEDLMDVPMFAIGMFFGSDWQIAREVELASKAILSIRGKRDKEKQMAQFGILGTVQEVEHAKQLISERIKGGGSKGKGNIPDRLYNGGSKGKGKGHARGKTEVEKRTEKRKAKRLKGKGEGKARNQDFAAHWGQ